MIWLLDNSSASSCSTLTLLAHLETVSECVIFHLATPHAPSVWNISLPPISIAPVSLLRGQFSSPDPQSRQVSLYAFVALSTFKHSKYYSFGFIFICMVISSVSFSPIILEASIGKCRFLVFVFPVTSTEWTCSRSQWLLLSDYLQISLAAHTVAIGPFLASTPWFGWSIYSLPAALVQLTPANPWSRGVNFLVCLIKSKMKSIWGLHGVAEPLNEAVLGQLCL